MTHLRSLSFASTFASIGVLGISLAGFMSACSGDRDRQGPAAPSDAVVETGTLNLALTARGESGALYRLRDAFFQVNDEPFNFFQQLSTENDPAATTLETNVPAGDFLITLFGGFSLERVNADGTTARVQSTLLSPSTQSFHIEPNEETFVTYQFETNGEVVSFGQGRLIIDIGVTERAGESRRTVIETNQDAVSNISLRETFAAALRNGGISSVSEEDVYHALIDSYNPAPGFDSSLRHCDDELTGGSPSLNGFPLACPRREGQLFDDLDGWFALAFVNRLDLAPVDGSNCGQQRVIFANNSGGRMFIIVEAQIPNPSPECGLSACLPLAQFWDSLATVEDPGERGRQLTEAFLFSGAGPMGPFMNARHLGPEGGQVRTNNFNDFQWTLREFQLQSEPEVLPIPVSVGEAPNGALWDDLSGQPRGEECRQSFLDSIPNLLSDNLATLGFPVAEPCEDAESPNDGFRQDYATHLGSGSGEFATQIDDALAGTGLGAFDIAHRARFAGSCMGCHIESSGAFLGRVSAPFSNDFVHVSEFALESCDGGTCFGISEALRNVFLPHRVNVQRSFLDSGIGCAAPVPGGEGADAGVAPLERSSGLRTLGGQPVVEHAH
jgi:hypothetical protein